MRIVLLGPPGAGKGTQAVRIAEHFDVPHVSTGDIFRANVREGTPLGREAKGYMDRGEYVPDAVTNAMVADRLARADATGGFVLDGYPRTVDQSEALESYLAGRDEPLDAVLRFLVPEEEFVRRLRGRRDVEGRSDDTEEAIRRRLVEYETKTAKLESFYAERGLLRDVDAVGSVDDVTGRALAALGAEGSADGERG